MLVRSCRPLASLYRRPEMSIGEAECRSLFILFLACSVLQCSSLTVAMLHSSTSSATARDNVEIARGRATHRKRRHGGRGGREHGSERGSGDTCQRQMRNDQASIDGRFRDGSGAARTRRLTARNEDCGARSAGPRRYNCCGCRFSIEGFKVDVALRTIF